MLHISEGYIDIQDTTLFYQWRYAETQNEETTLIFLHDALGSVDQWKNFPQLIAQKTGLTALIYDRQGHGKSEALTGKRTKEYLHIEALEILPQLIIQLRIKDYVLIGHSDGGSIALIHAAWHQPRAMVVMAPHMFVESITKEGMLKASNEKSTLVPLLSKYHKEKAEVLFDIWQETWLSEEFKDWTIDQEIKGIKCPVLGIQGIEDEYGTTAQLEQIEKLVKGTFESFWVPDARHMVHLEQPELIADRISKFLTLYSL